MEVSNETLLNSSVLANNIPSVGYEFNWEKADPLPIRPFANKRNFNVSMGLNNLSKTPEDWILIENTYLEQTRLRKKYTKQFPDQMLHCFNNKISTEALREFYELVTNYLLTRYPQYFTYNKKTGVIHNEINNEYLPRVAGKNTPKELELFLAANLEEDFLILIKDNAKDPEEEYILRAGVTGFPAGFDPSASHNKPISYIHSPVPQYRERLKVIMGRFFNKLEPKDLWVRHNWSIQTHRAFFNLSSNHGREGEKVKQLRYDEIDFENACFLRVERQIFTRLPKSRANVMTIRTYLTPIKKIKEEGLGEELCRAIDALPEELGHYKKRGAWGEAVKEFLLK
ncbi:uncharacterized protein RJT20DRAFT_151044 [Scheffersomyces xylosifermentans]|uniref:uncharacterized protein n=1 Tax=Scheffersomyces xylosifermentans TaxID=1304137 RepID=UPI00315D2AFD